MAGALGSWESTLNAACMGASRIARSVLNAMVGLPRTVLGIGMVLVSCWYTGVNSFLREVRMMFAGFIVQLFEDMYADFARQLAGPGDASYGIQDAGTSEPAFSNVSFLFHPAPPSCSAPLRPSAPLPRPALHGTSAHRSRLAGSAAWTGELAQAADMSRDEVYLSIADALAGHMSGAEFVTQGIVGAMGDDILASASAITARYAHHISAAGFRGRVPPHLSTTVATVLFILSSVLRFRQRARI